MPGSAATLTSQLSLGLAERMNKRQNHPTVGTKTPHLASTKLYAPDHLRVVTFFFLAPFAEPVL